MSQIPEWMLNGFIVEQIGERPADSLLVTAIKGVVAKVSNYYEGREIDLHEALYNAKGELAHLKEGKPFVPWGTCVASLPEEEE